MNDKIQAEIEKSPFHLVFPNLRQSVKVVESGNNNQKCYDAVKGNDLGV